MLFSLIGEKNDVWLGYLILRVFRFSNVLSKLHFKVSKGVSGLEMEDYTSRTSPLIPLSSLKITMIR